MRTLDVYRAQGRQESQRVLPFTDLSQTNMHLQGKSLFLRHLWPQPAWGTWRRVTVPACAQQLAVPSLHPKQPHHLTAVPENPTSIHLHTAGLRLLELAGLVPPCRALGGCSSWNYIASCVIQSTPHFILWLHTHTHTSSSILPVLKLCSVRGHQIEIVCTKSCAMHQ